MVDVVSGTVYKWHFIFLTEQVEKMIENRLPKSNEVLKYIAIAVLIVIMLGAGIEPSLMRSTNLARVTVDSTCLKGIGTELQLYAKDHSGFLPSGDNWIDQMIETQDMSPKTFSLSLSDCIEGESAVALNIAAAGRKLSELPNDLVLAFKIQNEKHESARDYPLSERGSFEYFSDYLKKNIAYVYKDRWNVACGPERLLFQEFNQASLVLFVDGSARWIEMDKLNTLRWDIENSDYSAVFERLIAQYNVFPEQFRSRAMNIGMVVAAIVIISIIIVLVFRPIEQKYNEAVLCFCFCTALLGGFLGFASEYFYPNSRYCHIGAIWGCLVGLLAALWFSIFILKQSRNSKRYLYFYSILLGVMCSAIIHFLLAFTLDSSYGNIILGMPYGVAAGYFLAGLFAKMINEVDQFENPQEVVDE